MNDKQNEPSTTKFHHKEKSTNKSILVMISKTANSHHTFILKKERPVCYSYPALT